MCRALGDRDFLYMHSVVLESLDSEPHARVLLARGARSQAVVDPAVWRAGTGGGGGGSLPPHDRAQLHARHVDLSRHGAARARQHAHSDQNAASSYESVRAGA